MTYIEGSLAKGENVYKIFPHHWMVKFSITLHFVLAFLTLGIWLLPAIWVWISWRKTEQGVTNRRVIHKFGVISLKTDEMKLSAIESITITQSIFGRMLGYGTVIVSGRGAGEVRIKWMVDPREVKKEIESADYADSSAM